MDLTSDPEASELWDPPSSVSTAGPQRPDRMPGDIPDRTPDRMPERMPEDMPDKVPECLPDRMPEGMPDRMSYRMPEGMPDRYETVPPPPLSTGPGALLIAARTAAANEKFVSLLLDWGFWDIAVASLQVTSVYIRLPPSNDW